MRIRIRVFELFLACLSIVFLSCVKHEVSFQAYSDIGDDGTFNRKGSLEIRIFGERDIGEDSLKMTRFYDDNYVIPDENLFKVSRGYRDSALTVFWEGMIAPENMPVSDYIHKSEEGSTAINSVLITIKNRWVYKDIIYRETFSDPVDTVEYFPMIQSRLSKASEFIMSHEALSGIRDYDRADELLNLIETKAGLDLFRKILVDPAQLDTIAVIYDDQISTVSDSLAGFEGVKQNPDSLDRLIHDVYDAAWDTLFSDHPGLFGSFALDDMDVHNFRVEVVVSGCLISSNSDTTIDGVSAWSFNRMDFFARDYTIEVVSRQWRWLNVAVTVLVIAIILFLILRPVRKDKES
ncbi:MAG: hypothetical protein JSU85_03700 [Candidatus Zixiibacteriota bacterium]|nr:MAG: hypothetical protein JSU85_03700 [candidate division Zixibacteria bacterium]